MESDQPGAPSPRFAATIRLLQQRLKEYDTKRARARFQSALVRGAAAGLAARGGLHLVSYLLGLLAARRRRGPGRRLSARSRRPSPRDLLEDTLRWGAFLGSFSGVYVFADELLAALGGAYRTRSWRAFVAGALAGPTILLTGPKARYTSLALYVLLKGLALLIRCGNLPDAQPQLRRALAPTRWRHGDVALMCISTLQIAYSWMVIPSTFPPAYARFLDKHGGKPHFAYEGVRELARRSAAERGPFQLAALEGSPHKGYCGSIPCEFWHPGHTCVSHIPAYWPGAYLRALPVYLPVYVVPALFVHGRRLLLPRTAPQIWSKVAAGVLRSSLFLSCYCTLAFAGACIGFRTTGRTTGRVIVGSCWIAGLALLLEKKSRRMELSQYVLSRVIEAFGTCLMEWGWLSRRSLDRRVDVLMFSLASAAILHCYSDHLGERRKVFRSPYLTAFDFILGNEGFGEASIVHQPSNADLLSLLEGRLSKTWPARLLRRVAARPAPPPLPDGGGGSGAAGGAAAGSGGGGSEGRGGLQEIDVFIISRGDSGSSSGDGGGGGNGGDCGGPSPAAELGSSAAAEVPAGAVHSGTGHGMAAAAPP